MENPIALFTADWHVRKYDRVWASHHDLAGDTAWGVSQVLDYVEQYQVPNLLLGGDNFEEKLQRSDAATLMRETMDRLEAREVAVWYVQGQHELADPPFVSAVHSWPQHLHGTVAQVEGVSTYGLDYQRPNRVQEALGDIPEGVELLLTHQVWKDIMGDDRGDAWAHWIQQPVMILSGDYHRRHDAMWVNGHNVPMTFISPGPLCMQRIDEPSDHWVVLLRRDLSVAWLPLRSRPVRNVQINSEEDLAQVLDSRRHELLATDTDLPAAVQRPIIRVRYSTAVEQCRARLAHALGRDAFLFWFPQVAETATGDLEAAERIETVFSGGLPATIRRYYNEDPEAAERAIRLLEADDHKREMQLIFQEMTEEVSSGGDHDREGALQDPGGGEAGRDPTDPRRRRPRL